MASGFAGNSSAGATVGHGLSVTPNLVIVREQNHTGVWQVGSLQPLASMDFTDALTLNSSIAKEDYLDLWNDTAPTSTLITLGNSEYNNYTGRTYIMYCFHSVDGFSKFGHYLPNASSSSDGPFIYTGFKPAWVMTKAFGGGHAWFIMDNTRTPNSVNPVGHGFKLTNSSEKTGGFIDILSNGFKTRLGADAWFNGAYGPYFFMAFAETPFKYTTAR